MDLAYFNIYKQNDEIFVPWVYSEENPEKCIYKKEVRTKMDLEDGISNYKWATIDIPLINFNHFDVLDIDWETVSDSVRVVASNLNLLVEELREEMTKRQAENGTPYFLSCAVPANSWGTVSSRFDFVTLDK